IARYRKFHLPKPELVLMCRADWLSAVYGTFATCRASPICVHSGACGRNRATEHVQVGRNPVPCGGLGGGLGECGAVSRPTAAARLAAVGLRLSRPLPRILAPARQAALGWLGRGARVPAGTRGFAA